MEPKQNIPPNQSVESGMSKGAKISIVLAVVFLLLIIAGASCWFLKFERKRTAQTDSQVQTAADQTQPVSTDAIVPKNNVDNSVEWYPAPKVVPTPQIYSTNNDFGAKTWEAGKFVSGKNSGSTIVLMAIYPEGPGGIGIARFIRRTDSQLLSLLGQYSNSISLSFGADINTSVLDEFPAYGVTINSLDYPGVLYTPHGEKMFKTDDFPVENLDDNLDSVFFKTNLLKKAFADPVYGDFYTTDPAKISEDNSYGTYAKFGFYVKAPDGTFKVYSLAVDFVGPGNVPDVIWNDGKKNGSKFSYQGSTGCGVSKHADVVDSEVRMADLAVAGKTGTGDAVYEFKDKNTQYLRDFYQEDADFMKENPEYLFEGKKFTKNTTYEQFVNSHVVFFWKDPFGRLVRFINTDYFIDPGGCGKPVIYLYPEKEQEISVKVSPSGGITVSDPAYGSGWNVIADPMSRIKNLADGKTYPYLFWEGKSKEIYSRSKFGFVADRGGLENLLNEKLELLGLNQKEIGDFKEYWLAKMLAENKPYYFFTFVPQDKIEKIAPLEISPQPDTVIRVLMDYQGLDEKIDARGYDIKTPERRGFVAVEWGGMLK